jgi:Putative Ig domain
MFRRISAGIVLLAMIGIGAGAVPLGAAASMGFGPADIVPPPAIATTALPPGVAGSPYAITVEATGGELPYQWSAGGLPPGLSIDPVSGRISGTPLTAICAAAPCPQPPEVLAPTIVVTDGSGTRASASLTLDLSGSSAPVMVATAGDGIGEVASDPPGIACATHEGFCQGSFEYTSPVTLIAKPSPGSIFEGWAGGGCAGTGACKVTWSQQVTFVVARFGKAQVPQPSPAPAPVSAPETTIAKAAITGAHAAFRFSGIGDTESFLCALSGPGRHAVFKPCTSPQTYRNLRPGRYAFSVRASGPGGTDATPAKRRFRVPR